MNSFAREGAPEEKRRLAVEIFGSNLTLDGQKLVGKATKPWDALVPSDPPLTIEPLHAVVRTSFGIPE